MIPLSSYDFEFPASSIAQTPVDPRDHSRLLVLDRERGILEDRLFYDLKDYLRPGDLLVMNDTKVIPARLYAKKKTGADIEVFLLEEPSFNMWRVMVRPGRKVRLNDLLIFGGLLEARVVRSFEDGTREISFPYDYDVRDELMSLGHIPLPPYIQYQEQLHESYKERYQTVFASQEGAVAAPTAGLHFTSSLLSDLLKLGIRQTYVTLHVGLGTFKPIDVEDLTKHPMHAERYCLNQECIDLIQDTKQRGGRVIAVGTTAVRVLEGVFSRYGSLVAGDSETSIFIYPPYRFNVVDAMITNFHFPKTTLLALVSAFSSRETILDAYHHAIQSGYRLFSFGDAMLII